MLTSACNLLNTILKGEKEDRVYVCGSAVLEDPKVEKTVRKIILQGMAVLRLPLLASPMMQGHKGRNFCCLRPQQ